MTYLLPHHHQLTSLDPLDICGHLPECIDENGLVKHKHIIEVSLNNSEEKLVALEARTSNSKHCHEWAGQLGELVQDLAYSLHNVGDLDTGFLQAMLATQPLRTLIDFRQNLFVAARSLFKLFPHATLDFLSESVSSCMFTPNETDALLAHLLLGTVQIPKGNDWGRPGFTSLYRDSPVVPSAVTGYLTTLIDHFARGGYTGMKGCPLDFTWTYSTTSIDITPRAFAEAPQKSAKITAVIKSIASEPTCSIPTSTSTFVLLSAHSQPGPGPAGTHEERLMGQSPALAITSLICPKLPANVALITSTFPVHAEWEGHNRYAKLVKLYRPEERITRCYIIADAAELDVAEHDGTLPDLKAGVVEREIGKLEAGFGGAVRLFSGGRQRSTSTLSTEEKRLRVEVVPWGCQAFGGDLVVKAQCMMMAGGLAGLTEIHLLVSSDREGQAKQIGSISDRDLTVGEMFRLLRP